MAYSPQQIMAALNKSSSTSAREGLSNGITFKRLLDLVTVAEAGVVAAPSAINEAKFNNKLRYKHWHFENVSGSGNVSATLKWITQEGFDDITDFAAEVKRALQALAKEYNYFEYFTIRLDVTSCYGPEDGREVKLITVNEEYRWHQSQKSSKADFCSAAQKILSKQLEYLDAYGVGMEVYLIDIEGARQLFKSHYLAEYLNYDSSHTVHDQEVMWINIIGQGGARTNDVIFEIGDKLSHWVVQNPSFDTPMFVGITYGDKKENAWGRIENWEFFTLMDFLEDGEFYNWYEKIAAKKK